MLSVLARAAVLATQQGLTPFGTSVMCYSALPHLDPPVPLRLFVCAAEPSGDAAGAALVAELRQQHRGGVELGGLGGPQLQAAGLVPAVSDAGWFEAATLAESVAKLPWMAHKIHPDDTSQVPSMRAYAQQLTALVTAVVRDAPSPAGEGGGGGDGGGAAPRGRSRGWDAVLTVGGRFLAPQLLSGLRTARKRLSSVVLPPALHYLPHDLWDVRAARGAAPTWRRLADHVLCAHGFEAAALHAAGCPATAVGHPLAARLLTQQRGGGGGPDGPGGGAWFKHQLAAKLQAGSLPAPPRCDSGGGSGSSAAFLRRHPQLGAAGAPRVALLPGAHETDVAALMPWMDNVTRRLAAALPGLTAVLLVPRAWANEAAAAASNFAVPVAVGDVDAEADAALGACTAALALAGQETLLCAAAGVPLVALLPGSMLHAALRPLTAASLPHLSLVNLVVGREGVPELPLWRVGAAAQAAARLQTLLTDAAARDAQRAVLREAMVEMVPAPASGGGLLQAPAALAARTLTDLVRLRRQQLEAATRAGEGAAASTGGAAAGVQT